jgi:predicted metal-dependent phosphotriesterase family hydrolase
MGSPVETATVRTVLGDIGPDGLGAWDSHDHLFMRSPLLPGQELDDPGAAEAELRAFRALGGRTVVQWTPYGMGRRIGDLARLSRATGVHVVAATGLHQAPRYAPETLTALREPGRLAGILVDELTRPRHPAGLIKVAGGFHGLDAHARFTMAAAAEAHHATGAPVAVHLELGTAAPDVVDLLCGTFDVSPERVILGHLNRFPDTYSHLEAARAGAFLAFDGPSRANHATDWRLPEVLAALVAHGYAERLLLGGDTTTAAARAASGGGPGMPYLLGPLRRRLAAELGDAVVAGMLHDNPSRAFAAVWRPAAAGAGQSSGAVTSLS